MLLVTGVITVDWFDSMLLQQSGMLVCVVYKGVN